MATQYFVFKEECHLAYQNNPHSEEFENIHDKLSSCRHELVKWSLGQLVLIGEMTHEEAEELLVCTLSTEEYLRIAEETALLNKEGDN